MSPEQKLHRVADMMKLVAHPRRLQILALLAQQGPLNVSAIETQLLTNPSSLSHHLIRMRNKGMLMSSRKGHQIEYSLNDPALTDALTRLLTRIDP